MFIVIVGAILFAGFLFLIGSSMKDSQDFPTKESGLFIIVNGILIMAIALFFFYLYVKVEEEKQNNTQVEQSVIIEYKETFYETA